MFRFLSFCDLYPIFSLNENEILFLDALVECSIDSFKQRKSMDNNRSWSGTFGNLGVLIDDCHMIYISFS